MRHHAGHTTPPVERSCLVVAESQAPAAAPRRRTRVPSAQLTLVVPPPDPAESVPGTTAGGAAVPADVVLVQDAATLATCRAAVAASGEVDLDIETTGLSPYTAAILTIQLWCESDGRTYVIPPAQVDRAALLDILGLLPEREVGAHNAAFEWSFLAAHFGIRLRRIWDSQVIEDVLQAGRSLSSSLEAVAARRLGIMLDKEIRKSFIGADPTTFRPRRAQIVYGAVDASILHQIREQQRREVQEQELGPTVALEMDVLPAIAAGGIVSESSADGPHDVPPRSWTAF
jgi:ribonuclease D